MKYVQQKYLLPLLIIVLFAPQAFANTATVSGTCYSLEFDAASTYIGGDLVEVYCTTYDGNLSTFHYVWVNNGYWFSQEVKKIGSLYYTDYITVAGGYIDDYGKIVLNLNSPDANGNGIDDVCEKSRSVNNSISGTWYSYDGSSGGISGGAYRGANFQSGSYSLAVMNTDVGTVPLSGIFYVVTLSGTVNYTAYSPGQKSIFLTYTVTSSSTESDSLASTYEIVDQDHIRVMGVDFFPTTTFTRNGTVYTADVVLTDGGQQTPWQDYEKWRLVIQDTNDLDGDGIPDLSDAVDNTQYTITASVEGANGSVSPTSVSVDKGESQTFTATPASGYRVKEWKVNGVVVQTGGASYALADVQDNATVTVSFCRKATVAP